MSDILTRLREAYISGNTAKVLNLVDELVPQIGKTVIGLPCEVGDTVYWFWVDGYGNPDSDIQEDSIYDFGIDKRGLYISINPYDGYLCHVKDIGKISNGLRMVFLTRPEAEQALERSKV